MAKIIQRKQQIYRTSQSEGGVSTLYADGPGGMRKMKCPSGCGGMAVPNQQADNKNRFICQICGMTFNAIPM